MNINELSDVLIIQLIIYRSDANRRKIFPNFVIDQHLDRYSLQGVIWHHGSNMDSGHYTCMVKHNDTMYHLSDAEQVNSYEVRYHSSSHEHMVPYLLFYLKNDTDLSNISLNVELPYPIHTHQVGSATSNKRTLEPILDDLNLPKKQLLEENSDITVHSEVPSNNLDEHKKESDDSQNVDKCDSRKFNFSKRKSKFSNKQQKIARERMQKIRATPEGREKHRESVRKSQERGESAQFEGTSVKDISRRVR